MIIELKLTDITELSAIKYGTVYQGHKLSKSQISQLNKGHTVQITII